MKKLQDMNVISVIEIVDEVDVEVPIEKRLLVETLAALMMDFNGEGIEDYKETVNALVGMGFYSYAPK